VCKRILHDQPFEDGPSGLVTTVEQVAGRLIHSAFQRFGVQPKRDLHLRKHPKPKARCTAQELETRVLAGAD
jgi:hypothetical protein